MVSVEDFVTCPSEDLLNVCTKEQLLKIAEHYEIDVGDKHLKDRVKAILKASLFERKVLIEKENQSAVSPSAAALSPPVMTSGLTF